MVVQQVSLPVQLFVGYDEASHAMGFKPLYLALAFRERLHLVGTEGMDIQAGPEITVRRNKVALDILLLAESPNPVELVENRNVQGLSPSPLDDEIDRLPHGAGVNQGLLGAFLLDGGFCVRGKIAVDDLILDQTFCHSPKLLKRLFGAAAGVDDAIGCFTARLQFRFMVLEALPHERPFRGIRGAELVVDGHFRYAGAVLILLVALEANLDLQVLQLLQFPEELPAGGGQI